MVLFGTKEAAKGAYFGHTHEAEITALIDALASKETEEADPKNIRYWNGVAHHIVVMVRWPEKSVLPEIGWHTVWDA